MYGPSVLEVAFSTVMINGTLNVLWMLEWRSWQIDEIFAQYPEARTREQASISGERLALIRKNIPALEFLSCYKTT